VNAIARAGERRPTLGDAGQHCDAKCVSVDEQCVALKHIKVPANWPDIERLFVRKCSLVFENVRFVTTVAVLREISK